MSDLPTVSKWMQQGFHKFLSPFLRRHFSTVAVHRDSLAPLPSIEGRPLIVYANHPSWWDPLIAHFLCAKVFQPRQFFAPIDAAALRQYQVFGKLGFFGVDQGSKSGAANFLRRSTAILNAPNTSLWLTPEGRFADCRDWEAPLMPGLAHLCTRLPDEAVLIALAIEYPFWEERLPAVLLRLSQPIEVSSRPGDSKADWASHLSSVLRNTQASLAMDVIARDFGPFEPLLKGKVGAGVVYDFFRRVKAFASRREFKAEHGEQLR